MGHIQHEHSAGSRKYIMMGKPKELDAAGIKDKTITNEFLNDKKKQQIAGQISLYAQESPLEFVAETYAELIRGSEVSKEVMELYEKYHGPKV